MKASFPVDLTDYSIPKPRYLGVGVKDTVQVEVVFAVQGEQHAKTIFSCSPRLVLPSHGVGRAGVSREAVHALHGVSLLADGRWAADAVRTASFASRLSTARGAATAPEAGAEDDPHGEQAFLYGALGDALGPVHLGLEMRPSRLRIAFPGGHQTLNLLMNLDLVGAVEKNGWTAYGTVGREPPTSAVRNGRTLPDSAFISYEHWISYQTDGAFGFALVDSCLPTACGLPITRPTAEDFDLDRNDQVYGVEVSYTMGPSLLQAMVSPGKAEAILHDRSHRGLSTAGRWQFDLRRARPSSARPSIVIRRSRSAVRYSGRRFRLRANVSRVDLDRGGPDTCRPGQRRELVGGGQ